MICGDAIEWLKDQQVIDGSVITSIPDFSEINMDPSDYKRWFVDIATSVLGKLRIDVPTVAIFYQVSTQAFI